MACLTLGLLAPSSHAAEETKRLFALPPLQWDREQSRDKPARIHGPSDLGNLTGGIVFGMQPADVNRKLPNPAVGVDWAGLSSAAEYPEDIRYFWIPFDESKDLTAGVTSCAGTNSQIVFLFRASGLFRMSWRLVADPRCPSPRLAAEDVYARFLAIDRAAALTTHYRPNKAETVDVTDPGASFLIPIRWVNRQRR